MMGGPQRDRSLSATLRDADVRGGEPMTAYRAGDAKRRRG